MVVGARLFVIGVLLPDDDGDGIFRSSYTLEVGGSDMPNPRFIPATCRELLWRLWKPPSWRNL